MPAYLLITIIVMLVWVIFQLWVITNDLQQKTKLLENYLLQLREILLEIQADQELISKRLDRAEENLDNKE